MLPELQPAREPSQLGPYRIVGVIGRGGMGTVYRAEVIEPCELAVGMQVAIKLLRQITDGHERQRFAREAGYLQALRHKGIVRVLDVGEFKGLPYLVMQLVQGHGLDSLICDGGLDESVVIEFAIQILEALHAAHLGGILHRDIKPSNIMITADRAVKLLDFGLAQRMDASSKITITGTVVGTPAYMSPEQANGERAELSRRSDIYSVGACLYELLTGQQPYVADNSMAVLRRIIDDPLIPPGRLRPGLSRDLETVVLKAMCKHPNDRYSAADDMAEDLRRIKEGRRIRSRRPSFMKPLMRECWAQRRTIAVVGLLVFVTFSAFGIVLTQVLRHVAQQDAQAVSSEPEWTTDWECPGPLQLPDGRPYIPAEGLDPGTQLAALDPVDGKVRLAVTLRPRSANYTCNLLICDSGSGTGGYRLRLWSKPPEGEHLSIYRDGALMKTCKLERLPRNLPIRVSIERDNSHIICHVNDQDIPFNDFVPIQIAEANHEFIGFVPSEVSIEDARLERSKSSRGQDGLKVPDEHLGRGQWALAIQNYEKFLRDQPNDALTWDAYFRIGLCHMKLKNYREALAKFQKAMALCDTDVQPDHFLQATFNAWLCAAELRQFENEESYLHTLLDKAPDKDELLNTIPPEQINKLITSYIDRADELAELNPDRAIDLNRTAAEFANKLRLEEKIFQGRAGAGDIMLAQGHVMEAMDEYGKINGDPLTISGPLRCKALLKIAEAKRQADRLVSAEEDYKWLIKAANTDQEMKQWCRLWLGDLYLQMDYEINNPDHRRALAQWQTSPEVETLPGHIMYKLVNTHVPIAQVDNEFFKNDIDYFNARMKLLEGKESEYHERLANIVRAYPKKHDWPNSLVQHLLDSRSYSMNMMGLPTFASNYVAESSTSAAPFKVPVEADEQILERLAREGTVFKTSPITTEQLIH